MLIGSVFDANVFILTDLVLEPCNVFLLSRATPPLVVADALKIYSLFFTIYISAAPCVARAYVPFLSEPLCGYWSLFSASAMQAMVV